MLQALRIPDFRLLWGGGLISSLGSWLLVLAIPAHILAVTGSLRDTGLTLAAQYLPQLVLGPVAGAVADRWDRRRLMIGADLACACAVAAMLLGTSPGRYWVLYAALIAESSGTVLYGPALQARVPAIVGRGPLLSSANSLTSASAGIVRLIGGPLGGILLAVCGIRWLICADALSYLLAAVATLMTSRSGAGQPAGTPAAGSVARDLLEGMRVLRGQPVARALLPVTVIFLAANASLTAVLIAFGVQRLGGTAHTGLLLSCLGAGFLLGAPVIRALLDRAGPRSLLTASLTATAAAYLLLFTSSSLATALPAAAAVAMSGSMSLVIAQTAVQRVVPGAALGRVSAVFLTGEAAATLAGSLAGPFLAQAAQLVTVAIGASLATLGAAALAFGTVPRLPAQCPRRGVAATTAALGPGAMPRAVSSGDMSRNGAAGPAPASGWLDGDQQRAWLAYIRVQLRLTYEMNRQLLADSGLSLPDYDVLTALSVAGGGRMTITVLAAQIGWERSRVSHHVRRMADRDLVACGPSVADRRVTEVTLTAQGRQVLAAAAPGHVDLVRRLFFDGLPAGLLGPLREALESVYATIIKQGSLPPPVDWRPAED